MSNTDNNGNRGAQASENGALESPGFAGNVAKTFIHSPLTPLFMILLLLIGLLGLWITPRQEDPQISVPMVDIFFKFPSASSELVESLATDPLERMMSEIPGVKHVYSASERGRGMVTVQFIVGEKMGPSLVKLYDKLQSNMDKIPPGVSPPLVKPRGVDDVPAVTLTLWSEEVDDAALRQLALEVMQRLKEVHNTSQSFIVGGRPEQMRVEFLPERLTGYGISVDQLAKAIRSANSRSDVGGTESGGRAVQVYSGKFLRHARDLESLIVGVRNGSPVYLRDVATVTEGPGEATNLVQYFSGPAKSDSDPVTDGAPAVTIAIAKKSGTNGVSVAEDILAKVEKLKGHLIPDNVQVATTRNYGKTANDKVNELLAKMLAATGAVCVLIWLFLGFRPTVVVGAVIPIVILITVFSAWLLNYTIDRVSLFALIFSIGILVDDATVVVENMYRRWLMKGAVDTETTIDAVREVGNPTVLATFAIIAALLPMGMVSGMMGPYMMPIPVLGSVAMLFSLLAAFMFTPWLAIRFRPSLDGLRKMEEREHRFASRLDSFFRALLGPLLNDRKKALMFRIGIWFVFGLALYMFATTAVAVKMLPLDNKPEFNVVLNMKEGTALPVTANVIQEMTAKVRGIKEVTAVQTYVGTASPFNFNGLVRHYYLRSRPWQGDIQIQLLEKGDRERSSHEIAVEARALLTPIARKYNARIEVVEMPPGPPVLQTMVAEVYGPDAKTRRAVAQHLTETFEKAETIIDVDNYMQEPHDIWFFQVNQRKAEHRNVSVADINRQLALVMGSHKLGSVKLGKELEPRHIILQAPLGVRAQIARLGEVPIRSRDNKLVPLSELGSFVPQKQDPIIYHKDLRPIEYVTGEVTGRLAAPIYSMIEINDLLKDYKTPAGDPIGTELWSPPEDSLKPSFEWTGEWTVTVETFRDMGLAFMAALVLIYMLVVLEFGNLRLPGIIMAPIPLTLIGIIPGHWLLGAEFTATSMIGWIALAGIIVRNSILLVDFSKRAVENGVEPKEAVIQAVCARTRPILITQLTMIAGSASIITDPIFQGMAISLLFGAVIATGLTLVVIPLACAKATGSYATANDGADFEWTETEQPKPVAVSAANNDSATSHAMTSPGTSGSGTSGSGTSGRGTAGGGGKLSGMSAGIAAKVKHQANEPGYSFLQPVYLIGYFISQALGYLLGRDMSVTEAAASASAGKGGSGSGGSGTGSGGTSRTPRPSAGPSPAGSIIGTVVAPVRESLQHLFGRTPAMAVAGGAAGHKSATTAKPGVATRSSASSVPSSRTSTSQRATGSGTRGGTKKAGAASGGRKAGGATTARRTPTKKATSKNTPPKKAASRAATTTRKTTAKKTPARKTAAARSTVAKTAATKSSTRRTVAKSAGKSKTAGNAAAMAPGAASKNSKASKNSNTVAKAKNSKARATGVGAMGGNSAAGVKSGKSAKTKATTGKSNSGPRDDLQQISGIGPALVKKLNARGVTRFDDIAKWKKADVETFDAALNFKGRIEREDWIAQAGKLVRKAQMRTASENLKTKSKKKSSKPLAKSKKSKTGGRRTSRDAGSR